MSTPTPEQTKQPEHPKLFIDAGIVVTGDISFDAKPNDLAVIKGKLVASVQWPGKVMVCEGGELVVRAGASIRDLHVSGKLTSETPDAEVEAGFLVASNTAHIELGSLSLPPGGLEQRRGAVLNASLRMSDKNRYASSSDAEGSRPALVIAVNNDRTTTPGAGEPGVQEERNFG